MNKARKGPAFLVIFLMLLLIVAYIYAAYQTVKPARGLICNGVFVETVNVGGMSEDEARTAVTQYRDEYLQRTVEVDVNGKTVSATLEQLGYNCEVGDVIAKAMQVGKDGNPFTNYAKIREIATTPLVYKLKYDAKEKKIRTFVNKKCKKKCAKAKNAKVKRENGTFVYTDAKEGSTIDVDSTAAQIKKAVEQAKSGDAIRVKADVTIQEPTVTKDLASRCKDKIGSFQTNFNAGNVSRSKNLSNAARLINDHVIYPGETFSVHDTISPLTEENGYYAAPSYSNGEVVDSIGGGVCQVSTTLYNAVLKAELEVVERSPHSMVVSYVKPSMDAAIAGDYKDFKFRNDTEVPIYIEGGVYSGTIYFNIYGEETRSDDREVTFESETTQTMQPGADKITYDKTKPVSYTKVTQEAHVGYKAVLWKIVKENGKTKKTQINSSTYQAVPRYVTKGAAEGTPAASGKPQTTKKATKEPKATAKPKKTAKPKATVKPKKTAKPKATVKPQATAVPAAAEPTTEAQ